MDVPHSAATPASSALTQFLASLDSADQLTAEKVSAALRIALVASPDSSHRATGTLALGGTGHGTVTLYTDVLDDSQRRMLVEVFAADATYGGVCTLDFMSVSTALLSAGYRRLPRARVGEPEPATFVRGPVVIEFVLASADDADTSACIRQLVVR